MGLPVVMVHMGVSIIAGWFVRENPIQMDDDWGYPHFRKPPYIPLLHIIAIICYYILFLWYVFFFITITVLFSWYDHYYGFCVMIIFTSVMLLFLFLFLLYHTVSIYLKLLKLGSGVLSFSILDVQTETPLLSGNVQANSRIWNLCRNMQVGKTYNIPCTYNCIYKYKCYINL